LLNWTQHELAAAAGVARKTVADFEGNLRTLRWRTRRDITETLERAGIEFIGSGDMHSEGVQIGRGGPPMIISGQKGVVRDWA
jgi:DNA-binding XRE family transcriptional regulator